MSDDEEDSQITSGGKKKSNGHKATCKCPICKNMKHSKKGGSMSTLRPANFLGGKKANGHKANCKCPICVNMKHQKASKKNRRVKRSKRTRRGGRMIPPSDTPTEVEPSDEYALIPADNNVAPALDDSFDEDDNADIGVVRDANQNDDNNDNANIGNRLFDDDDTQGGKKKRKSNGHKANCKCPICKNMKMKKGGAADDDSSDSDSSSNSESSSDSVSDTTTDPAIVGGKKKRKGNGHKANCKCPICKNMKKGGVKSPYADKDPDYKQKDAYRAHQELVDAERGESKLGKENTQSEQTKATNTNTTKIDVGGSRRRRKTRKSRKTRKIRRRR